MGRRLKATPEVLDRARKLVESGGKSVEEAAKEVGVGKSQLYARGILNPAAVGHGRPVKGSAAATHSRPGGGAKARPGAKPGPASPDPVDHLAVVRRILAARNPGALRELEDGLAVAAAGEPALAAWLARPITPAAVDTDPLVELCGALAKVKAQLETFGPGHARAASTAGALTTIAKAIEAIRRGRPDEETEDEIVQRLRGLDQECKAEIEALLVEHEARAARPRPGAPHGVCVTCEAPLTVELAALP